MLVHAKGILARHILRQLLVPFLCCFGGFLFLFFIVDLQDEIGDMLKKPGRSAIDILCYFLFILPEKVPLITPMALLLGTMYCFANLNRHNEINAMRSSGISTIKLSLPAIILSILVSILLFLTNEYFQGYFSGKAKVLHEQLTGERKDSPELGFTIADKDGERQWNLKFNDDGSFSRLSLAYLNNDGNIKWTIDCHKGVFSEEQGWTFYNGKKSEFNEDNFPLAPKNFKELKMADILDDPVKMRKYNNYSGLTIAEINRRKNSSIKFSERDLQFMDVKFYTLIFSPFACIISVLLGIPLSITQQRQGALTSAAKALGIMILYYMLLQVFQNLGNHGILPAIIAGSAPTLCFLGLGLYISLRK